MINMFITNGMNLYFLSYPESMGISDAGSFPVHSRGSLLFASSFRIRKLTLNRINHLH